MYDRKTWIVVTICALLLGLNLYFAPKPPVPAPKAASEQAALPGEPAAPVTPPAAGLEVVPPAPAVAETLLRLETPKATFVLTNLGAGVKETLLKDEHEIGAPDKPVAMNNKGVAIATLLDDHEAEAGITYDAGTMSADARSVVYTGQSARGIKVTKTFSLVDPKLPGSDYLLDLNLTFENTTAQPVSTVWSLALGTAAPLYARETPNWTSFFWRGGDTYSFEDASYFKGKLGASDKPGFQKEIDAVEYTGVANQFFATVVRAKEPYSARMWARPVTVNLPAYEGGLSRPAVRGGMGLPPEMVSAGGQRTLAYQIFMGPKKNQMLGAMDGKLRDVMNYGVFRKVSSPLNWLLNKLHGVFDGLSPKWSWGFAVIALTIVIRTLIWPLHAKSTRTMKRMSKIQPEQKALKEKYGDDPTRLNQETMKLYKKYGVNPLGGCLPMFLQIPIFFGFYRMLQYAVELRHQEFLWVHDLSQPDTLYTLHAMGLTIPLNVLPILMGITMIIQMRMTPQTGDAMQRKIMMFMPLMFLYFCYSFASALALYWTTQNLFSIGQTWLMNKLPEPELKSRKVGKKSWVEKLSERQEEIKRAQKNGGGAAGPGVSKKKRPPRTGG